MDQDQINVLRYYLEESLKLLRKLPHEETVAVRSEIAQYLEALPLAKWGR